MTTEEIERVAKILADETLDIACDVFRLGRISESEIYDFRKEVMARVTLLLGEAE